MDPEGNLYISDRSNNRIRKVDANGIITSIAGLGAPGYRGDFGPAKDALLKYALSATRSKREAARFLGLNEVAMKKNINRNIILDLLINKPDIYI